MKSANSVYSSSEGVFIPTATYGYDGNGDVISVTNANGIVTSYVYGDNYSRVIGKVENSGGGSCIFDNFNDGSITDGDPLTWSTYGD